MRLPPFPPGHLPGGFTAEQRLPAAAPSSGGLLGSWSATRWQYAAREGERRVDVVCDLAGTITLSISPGTWILSFVVPAWGQRTVGGTWRFEDDRLWLGVLGTDSGAELRFRASGELLSLNADACDWPFDGADEPGRAVLRAVLVRL